MDFHRETCIKYEPIVDSIKQAMNYPKQKKREENRNKINEKKIFGFESVKKKVNVKKKKAKKVKKKKNKPVLLKRLY